MRHRKSGRHLSRTSSHRKAMFQNMAVSLFEHELIKTTLPKAKELRRVAEPLITLAKTDSLANRRLAFDRTRSKAIVGKLFNDLGLSQVFGFAKQSGGNIDVASTLGQGSVFTLYLPQVEAQTCAQHSAQESPVPTHDAAQCHVLIVEDNLEVGRFASQILQDLGYQTTWATDAEQALTLAGQDAMAFDVIFSDVVMPGITGVAMARQLRQRRADLPVVLTSGYSDELAESGYEGFEFLAKPYSAEQVSRVLTRAMLKD